MNGVLQVSLDQIIPLSRARANLSTLVEKVKKRGYFVIAKKYKPTAAIVDLGYLSELIAISKEAKRNQRFKGMFLAASEPVPEQEISEDVSEAISAVRSSKDLSTNN